MIRNTAINGYMLLTRAQTPALQSLVDLVRHVKSEELLNGKSVRTQNRYSWVQIFKWNFPNQFFLYFKKLEGIDLMAYASLMA